MFEHFRPHRTSSRPESSQEIRLRRNPKHNKITGKVGKLKISHISGTLKSDMYDICTSQNKTAYGILHGNATIVFIKPGLGGSIYGYKNKYLLIAKKLNERYGCTVICSENNGNMDFGNDMTFVKKYAVDHHIPDFKIYFFGHSNGALQGMCEAFKFAQIKRLLLINTPLMINPHKTIPGIKNFNGEKMYLVFGSEDPSYSLLQLYSQLESEKVQIDIYRGADHHFKDALDLFMTLPEKYLFFDTFESNKSSLPIQPFL